MTTPDPGARSINVTSEHATSQHERAAAAKREARERYERAEVLRGKAPAPKPEPKTQTKRPRLKVTTPKAPRQPVTRVLPTAGAATPGRDAAAVPGSARTLPPGSVVLSKREFEAVVRLTNHAAANWTRSGQRGSVGQTKKGSK